MSAMSRRGKGGHSGGGKNGGTGGAQKKKRKNSGKKVVRARTSLYTPKGGLAIQPAPGGGRGTKPPAP
jgi:hypothetical protein